MAERRTAKTHPLLIAAGLVVVIAGVKAAEQIAVPFLLAAFIATIAATPVFWLNRFRVPVGVAIALVLLCLVALLIGVGAVVAQSATTFQEQLPGYQAKLGTRLAGVQSWLAGLGIELSAETLDPGRAWDLAADALLGLGNMLSNGFLILLTVLFILGEASSFPQKLKAVLSDPNEDLPHFERFAANVNRYMAIKTSVSLLTGVFVGVALWIIGVDFPILWGLLAFLLNYVPNIGSFIAAVPPVLLAIVQLGAGHAIATLTVFVVVNVAMGSVVEPRFMGRALSLSTLVVFLSLVFWGWVLGPVGMLLSVPLTMTAKIAFEANPSTEWIAHLLDPAERTRVGNPTKAQ